MISKELTEVAYEGDVHKLILDNEDIFGDLGRTTVILEKKLHNKHVIADVLILSEIRGIIGVEIKTAHDSTQRLNKQLNAYKEFMNEVWVVIADEQYEKVSKVLANNSHDEVGIISYGQIKGKLYPGVVRYPKKPKSFDPKNIYRVMWKAELVAIANALSSSGEILAQIYTNLHPEPGTLNYEKSGGGKGRNGGSQQFNKRTISGQSAVVTSRMTKEQIIDYIFNRLGYENAFKLIIDMWLAGTKHPDKVLKSYHFKPLDKDTNYELV